MAGKQTNKDDLHDLLVNAIYEDDIDSVRLILDTEPDFIHATLDARMYNIDKSLRNAPLLHVAVFNNSREMAELLIEKGADPIAVDKYGRTAGEYLETRTQENTQDQVRAEILGQYLKQEAFKHHKVEASPGPVSNNSKNIDKAKNQFVLLKVQILRMSMTFNQCHGKIPMKKV